MNSSLSSASFCTMRRSCSASISALRRPHAHGCALTREVPRKVLISPVKSARGQEGRANSSVDSAWVADGGTSASTLPVATTNTPRDISPFLRISGPRRLRRVPWRSRRASCAAVSFGNICPRRCSRRAFATVLPKDESGHEGSSTPVIDVVASSNARRVRLTSCGCCVAWKCLVACRSSNRRSNRVSASPAEAQMVQVSPSLRHSSQRDYVDG